MCLKWGGGERKQPPYTPLKGGGKKKNIYIYMCMYQLQPENRKLEEINLPPKIMTACPDPGRGSSPVYNRQCWSSCIGSPDD